VSTSVLQVSQACILNTPNFTGRGQAWLLLPRAPSASNVCCLPSLGAMGGWGVNSSSDGVGLREISFVGIWSSVETTSRKIYLPPLDRRR
jgi:hypothetical protein